MIFYSWMTRPSSLILLASYCFFRLAVSPFNRARPRSWSSYLMTMTSFTTVWKESLVQGRGTHLFPRNLTVHEKPLKLRMFLSSGGYCPPVNSRNLQWMTRTSIYPTIHHGHQNFSELHSSSILCAAMDRTPTMAD